MAYVYIIQDRISKKYYTGSCLELSKRIKRHSNNSGSRTTSVGEWYLVAYLETSDIQTAIKIERLVKSYKGGNAFKKIINGDVAEWSKAPHC